MPKAKEGDFCPQKTAGEPDVGKPKADSPATSMSWWLLEASKLAPAENTGGVMTFPYTGNSHSE